MLFSYLILFLLLCRLTFNSSIKESFSSMTEFNCFLWHFNIYLANSETCSENVVAPIKILGLSLAPRTIDERFLNSFSISLDIFLLIFFRSWIWVRASLIFLWNLISFSLFCATWAVNDYESYLLSLLRFFILISSSNILRPLPSSFLTSPFNFSISSNNLAFLRLYCSI